MITTLNRMTRALARAQTDDALEQVMADLDLDRIDIIGEEAAMDRLAAAMAQCPAPMTAGVRLNLDQVVRLAGQPSCASNARAMAGMARLLWRQMGQLLMLIPEMARAESDQEVGLYAYEALLGLGQHLEDSCQGDAAEALWRAADGLDPEGLAQTEGGH